MLRRSRVRIEMPDVEESHLVRERAKKLDAIRSAGREPYPWEFSDRVATREVVEAAAGLEAGAHDASREFRVAGRLGSIREHGKTAFLDLADESGSLQLLARVDELGVDRYRELLATVDPGDIVGAAGVPLRSRRGEPSLLVRELTMLAKGLHPPPEKYHGLADAETRIRQRYVDLLASPETRRRYDLRARIVGEMRRFLNEHGFREFETPVLTPVAGGAAAHPFVTHSNYLDADVQLRVAIELYLKRLLVGGFEKVYEIGPIFRNEDLDATHSPEFTMLEAYWAYADYRDVRGLVESLYARLAERVAEWLPDDPVARAAPDRFRIPFATVDFVEELERRSGLECVERMGRDELLRHVRAAGLTVPDESTEGKFLEKLFEHYVEPKLIAPTFVLDHPESTTPLAKRHRSKPGRVERFEVFADGVEHGNAYTELNDPVEQERRFREQLATRGEEQYAYDADFLEALRYGMPPAGGVGLGVDRIVMSLLGIRSIKDVILFPAARTREEPTR